MEIVAGVSNRHIHLSQEHVELLFGQPYEYKLLKMLMQPGQYACEETVTITGPKGSMERIRILGPIRSKTQLEISKTDCFALGIDAPVRMSGDIEGTPGIEVTGPHGQITLTEGVIIAARHVHLHPKTASLWGVNHMDKIAVKSTGTRTAILENVICRVSEQYVDELHVDTDEANAAGIRNGDIVKVML